MSLCAKRQQFPVRDLPVVEQYVRVHVRRHPRRALPDERADLGPGAALPVKQ